jgi:hypothetical protein
VPAGWQFRLWWSMTSVAIFFLFRWGGSIRVVGGSGHQGQFVSTLPNSEKTEAAMIVSLASTSLN